jgi:hypothetical protein
LRIADGWQGKMTRGEVHGNAILSEDQVTKIYQLAHSGRFTLDELALAFGVSKPTIASIKVGRNWKWLTEGKGSQ